MVKYKVKITCKFCGNKRMVYSGFRHAVGDTINWSCPCKKDPDSKYSTVGSSSYTVVSCDRKGGIV